MHSLKSNGNYVYNFFSQAINDSSDHKKPTLYVVLYSCI